MLTAALIHCVRGFSTTFSHPAITHTQFHRRAVCQIRSGLYTSKPASCIGRCHVLFSSSTLDNNNQGNDSGIIPITVLSGFLGR